MTDRSAATRAAQSRIAAAGAQPTNGDGGSRRDVLAGAVGLSLTAAVPALAATSGERSKENAMSKPSVVFAHGIWADGSSFQKLIPALRAEGHEVVSAQYGLDTVKGDVDATIRALRRVSAPVVLVGHSYGGAVITYAGVDPSVAALVYIAALAPDETETSQTQLEKFPKTDVLNHVEAVDGRLWLKPEGVASFAGDLSPEEQAVVYATQFAPAADLFTQKHDGVAWRTKPSWVIVATEDHTVNPELERATAKRMGAHVTEVKSSHVVMLSRPREVLDVIRAACAAVAAKQPA
jgi:pimeloyl-ACP methyl ester carboxylesterase